MLAEAATMIAAGSVLMLQRQKEAVMQRGGCCEKQLYVREWSSPEDNLLHHTPTNFVSSINLRHINMSCNLVF